MTLPQYGQPIARIELTQAMVLAALGSGAFVSSVTGTANQVAVAPTTGAVVVSLPTSGTLPGTWHAATGFVVDAGNLDIDSDAGLLRLGAAQDVILSRDAANVLSMRNGTTPQSFSIYSTYSGGGANYERFTLGAVAGASYWFRSEQGGTGVARGLDLLLGGTLRLGGTTLSFMITGTPCWGIVGTGNLVGNLAAARITGGATSLALRNAADNADNVLVSDAGVVTIRAGLTMAAGQILVTPDVVSIANSDQTNTGWKFTNAFAGADFISAGSPIFRIHPTEFYMAKAAVLGWADIGGGPECTIGRSAAGVLITNSAFLFPATTASLPSIRLPHGIAPSAPTNGDVWTTTVAQFNRINGVTEEVMYV